jgi:hypothetical protein
VADEAWRAEADDEWLAEHRSDQVGWLRRRLSRMRWLGDAFSHAETGPYAGAPRNPRPRVEDDKAYATIRYTTDQIAYTTTSTDPDECARCGQPVIEKHEIEYVQGESTREPVGAVRTCRSCQAESWLLHSRMPSTSRARDAARKIVV